MLRFMPKLTETLYSPSYSDEEIKVFLVDSETVIFLGLLIIYGS